MVSSPLVTPPTVLEELLAASPYRWVNALGRGAMGEVHVVAHRFLERQFALKILDQRLASNAQAVDRMRVEAQAAARLQHPNVALVTDFWRLPDGRPCFVMELLQGCTLDRELAGANRLSLADARDFALQALSALSAAHAIGIVHRDIRPENLYLHRAPGLPRVLKVLDFGLARVLPDASSDAPAPLRTETGRGFVVGSPRFLSPEAERGATIGPEGDLYAMGVVLYIMITGRGPFDAAEQPRAPSEMTSGVTAEVDAVVLRAIRHDPEERYPSADAFAADLARVRTAFP
jgi:serine/threonine-protein kinase